MMARFSCIGFPAQIAGLQIPSSLQTFNFTQQNDKVRMQMSGSITPPSEMFQVKNAFSNVTSAEIQCVITMGIM